MIKHLYDSALKFRGTRLVVRRLRQSALSALQIKDAYADLSVLCQRAPATTYLDIGCHHGQTILRARESGIRCPIVGIDPIAENLSQAKTLLRGIPDVSFLDAALSDTSGSETFFLNQNDQTSSLLENDTGNAVSFPDDTTRLGTKTIRTLTLDEYLEGANLDAKRLVIKCDVQGAEERLIEGGKKAFASNVVGFYAEIMLAPMYQNQASFERISTRLEKDFDMVLHNLYACVHDRFGRAVQTDGLWVRRDCLSLLR